MYKYPTVIVKNYISLLLELMNRLQLSSVFYKLSEPDKIIYNGFNVIQHVFEYSNNKTNNIETSFYISQQACNYYCEYIEQIHNSNLIHSLDHNDAIIFVYKKTIFELYNKTENSETGLTNSMYLLQQNSKDNNGNITSQITKVCHEFMYWENNYTIDERKFICEYYLPKILSNNKHLNWYIENIQLLKNKFSFQYNDYISLIDEMLKITRSQKKINNIDDIILNFYNNQDVLENYYNENNITKIVKVLIFH